jgi:hypothetical protein
MAVRLSALRAGRPLLPRIFQHSPIPSLPCLLSCLRLPSPELDSLLDNNSLRVKVEFNFLLAVSKVKVKVALRVTVIQSISLDDEPHVGLMTRYLLLFESYGLVFVGRPL